ncbi:MAG: type IVB secretion system protein IcmH/DotU [Aquabacterium sp.]|jgi:type VI secretion system protein ImpK|uniref:type IVB secretion system protein IcmH/DotU n=1 Tax=Aquabacterium sp. TaxID=1872578 RepID=UPI001B5275E0|nr:type IVB secretion system protein IcmH/DotU [Aquabacterium sp.]MBP7132886.1 type IVB secretion system protein IcmH/DotU [Aquabacterium sp.]MBP9063380.1 type IVB secretion system protein IcmH/DotU [Aquabacterium sp.]MDQ5925172.1 type secretion system protein ImpK [Pseudomonadota bacterium]
MTSSKAPSLFGSPSPHHAAHAAPAAAPTEAHSLLDLMYDGFYLLFLLKGKHAPQDAEAFRERIKQFLTAFERGATRMNASAEDVYACKYAFCATVDEAVLMSGFKVKEAWQRLPLQVQFFGEQLAGEQFFEKLEELRRQGAPRVQAMEVFHMCLLLGFQGKYLIEGSEKLGYLTARLGDEIARIKGQGAGFAPHWAAPDRIQHQLKNEVPLWVVASVFGLMALLAYTGLRWQLGQHTFESLAQAHHIVQLAPQVANITITLP